MPFGLLADNDLSLRQLGPPLKMAGSALMPSSRREYNARHMCLHFAYPSGPGKYYALFGLDAFVPIAILQMPFWSFHTT
jgi:hypothetical protein